MTSDRSSQVQIALSDRYEAPYVVKRNGYFYLFVSAGACCDGALSGYGVYAARSPNVLGRTASVLIESAPTGDYMVEVKLVGNVPPTGVFNFVQGGIIIYQNDFNFVKLDSVAINNTRQIEFAKQYEPGAVPRYGNTFLASPADTTYLRIVKRTAATSEELYSSYSSHDGFEPRRSELGTGRHMDSQLGIKRPDRADLDGRQRLHKLLRLRSRLRASELTVRTSSKFITALRSAACKFCGPE